MKQPSKISAGLALAFAAVLLASCSDGDSNSPAPAPAPTPAPAPAPTPAPAPAPSASSDPSIALVRQLVAQGGNNTAEPLVLSNQPFATSDTTEPESI